MDIRVGNGFDVHALVEGRALVLGGVRIPHPRGLLGHSDADVLLHALCDAILGALAEGDIGRHFPDTDPRWKGVDSRLLLRHVASLARERGWRIGNLDATLVAQAPKVAPYVPAMRSNIAADVGCAVDAVGVKATTTEQLGFTGRGEGIAALATVLLVRGDGYAAGAREDATAQAGGTDVADAGTQGVGDTGDGPGGSGGDAGGGGDGGG
jgi:2-C-methyl-D-erythritol 2,4-cyclodiphosphate synthase